MGQPHQSARGPGEAPVSGTVRTQRDEGSDRMGTGGLGVLQESGGTPPEGGVCRRSWESHRGQEHLQGCGQEQALAGGQHYTQLRHPTESSSSPFLGKLPASRSPAHLVGPYWELGRGSGTPRWARNSCFYIFARKKHDPYLLPFFSQGRRGEVGTARCRTPGATLRLSCRGRCVLTCCGSSRRWGSSVLRCVVEVGFVGAEVCPGGGVRRG